MTEIRKPGGYSKVASMPFVFQLKQLVINTLPIMHTSCYSSYLKIGLGMPKAFKKLILK